MTNLIIMDGIDNSPAKLDSLHICGESPDACVGDESRFFI